MLKEKNDKYLCGPEAEQDLRMVNRTEAGVLLGPETGRQQWCLRSHLFRTTEMNSASS